MVSHARSSFSTASSFLAKRCLQLARKTLCICLHRISFQFQSNSKRSHSSLMWKRTLNWNPSRTLWPRSCHHPLLAAPRSACGVPRGVAFTPQCSFWAKTSCFHSEDVIEPKWTHLIDLHLNPQQVLTVRDQQSVFSIFCFCSNSERLILFSNIACLIFNCFLIFFINPINSVRSAS